jgi:glycosyltransferase involved in cell wall biosynthesis
MNVLLVGMGNKKLLIDIHHNLLKENIKADLLDPLEGYFINSDETKWAFGKTIVSKNFLKKNILLYLNFLKIFRFFKKNDCHYDVCNIHYTDVRYFFIRKRLFNISEKLVISVYGSDFNKYKKYDFFQKPFYKKAKRITLANEITKDHFDAYYKNKFSSKLSICRFGLSLIPLIKEAQSDALYKTNALKNFNFPEDKIIITIGYNSSPNNQQLKVIEEILKIDSELLKKIFLVFPMTYGGFANNIKDVESILVNTSIPYSIIRNFLNTQELVLLRIASDIMIQLPISDQLSATMCEYLYTRNWVITAKWLPYESIDQTGVKYDRIESFDQLTDRLEEILQNFTHFTSLTEQNPERIWDFSSWKQNINAWIDVYNA